MRWHGTACGTATCWRLPPTATISTIIGVSQSIEPAYKLLYAKSNLSGEFTQVNETLVAELRQRGLWDAAMLDELKYYDGSLQNIGRIPLELLRFRPVSADVAWCRTSPCCRQR